MKQLLFGVLCTFILLTTTACVSTTARVADLEAATDIEIGMAQQDVYVTKADAPDDQIFRVGPDEVTEAVLAEPAYATMEINRPDMFDLTDNPRGPYAKGEALGFTMGEWLAVEGTAVYTKRGDLDEVRGTLSNLRPNAVYTLWCSLGTAPPDYKVFELPCGNPDGSDSIYQSDANGNLSFHKVMSPMPYATDNSWSALCFAYHSDGLTYGSVVGDYGYKAHIHTCFDVLPEDSEMWENTSTVQAAGM